MKLKQKAEKEEKAVIRRKKKEIKLLKAKETREERKTRIQKLFKEKKFGKGKNEAQCLNLYRTSISQFVSNSVDILYLNGHILQSDSTNIRPDKFKDYLQMPIFSPEFGEKVKTLKKKDSEFNINQIPFPYGALFPRTTLFFLLIILHMIRIDLNLYIWVIILCFLPLYYFDVKNSMRKYYEKKMRELNIPYDS